MYVIRYYLYIHFQQIYNNSQYPKKPQENTVHTTFNHILRSPFAAFVQMSTFLVNQSCIFNHIYFLKYIFGMYMFIFELTISQFQQTSPELLQPRGVTFTEHPPKHM